MDHTTRPRLRAGDFFMQGYVETFTKTAEVRHGWQHAYNSKKCHTCTLCGKRSVMDMCMSQRARVVHMQVESRERQSRRMTDVFCFDSFCFSTATMIDKPNTCKHTHRQTKPMHTHIDICHTKDRGGNETNIST